MRETDSRYSPRVSTASPRSPLTDAAVMNRGRSALDPSGGLSVGYASALPRVAPSSLLEEARAETPGAPYLHDSNSSTGGHHLVAPVQRVVDRIDQIAQLHADTVTAQRGRRKGRGAGRPRGWKDFE